MRLRAASAVFTVAIAIVLSWPDAVGPLSSGRALAAANQPTFDFPWEPGTMHYWTGGPHGTLRNKLCLPNDPPKTNCAADVKIENRSGIDFGQGGWSVRPMAPGQVTYSGVLPESFGYGVIVDHGPDPTGTTTWQTVYVHMANDGSLRAAGPVTRADTLGVTGCTGGRDGSGSCGSAPHLHVELRVNGTVTHDRQGNVKSVNLGTRTSWNAVDVGGWTIYADESTPSLNYIGYATRGQQGVVTPARVTSCAAAPSRRATNSWQTCPRYRSLASQQTGLPDPPFRDSQWLQP